MAGNNNLINAIEDQFNKNANVTVAESKWKSHWSIFYPQVQAWAAELASRIKEEFEPEFEVEVTATDNSAIAMKSLSEIFPNKNAGANGTFSVVSIKHPKINPVEVSVLFISARPDDNYVSNKINAGPDELLLVATITALAGNGIAFYVSEARFNLAGEPNRPLTELTESVIAALKRDQVWRDSTKGN